MTEPAPTLRRSFSAAASGWFAMLFWSGLFWGVLYKPLGVFQDATPAVAQAADILAREHVPEGTHFFPWPRDTPEARTRWLAAHRAGPILELHWRPSGADSESPSKFMAGMLQYAVVAAFMTLLARKVRALGGTARDVTSSLLATAGVAVVFVDLTPPIWFDMPWKHFLSLAFHDVVALGLLVTALRAGHR